MKKFEPIILPVFMQLHDRVINYAKQPRAGRVIGFYQADSFVAYGRGKRPGKYTTLGAPMVVYDDGQAYYTSCHELAFESVDHDARCKHIYEQASILCPGGIVSDLVSTYVCALPATDFLPGDKVALKPGFLNERQGWDDFKVDLYVGMISYHRLTTLCSDGVTPYPIYTLSPYKDGGMYSSFRSSDFTLVERGNLWHYYFGDKADMKFADIPEEAAFYKSIGDAKQVRDPETTYFIWAIDKAVAAVRAGVIDAITHRTGMFGQTGEEVFGYKFDDPVLGEKVRTHTIEGFKGAYETT